MTLTFAKIAPWISEVLPPSRRKGGRVFLDEGGDFIRGIVLNSSMDPDRFYVEMILDTLYIPKEYIAFKLGNRIKLHLSSPLDHWSKTDPNLKHNLQNAIIRDTPAFFAATDGYDKIIRAFEKTESDESSRRWYIVGCCHARQNRLRDAAQCWNMAYDKADGDAHWQIELRGWVTQLLTNFEKSADTGQEKLNELVAQSRLMMKI